MVGGHHRTGKCGFWNCQLQYSGHLHAAADRDGILFFEKRENLTDEFFLAGQRIPWWAAGMSIYATQLSAITFIAIPAVAYSTNWLVYPGYLTIFLMVPLW
jgi:hypothetical protein